MTERLYYTDSYLAEFESEVMACVPSKGRFEVTLTASAFYPSGGGQPHDLGQLGGRTVLDVIDREDQGVAHIIDGPLEPGTKVKGLVEWARRFDHMQQHSGQHLLSAAFASVAQALTESFHLGVEASTIDLSRLVSPAEIAAVEDEVNRVVWADREVRVCFAAADDPGLALRKESARTGTLRLIDMDGFDRSACGGTHVSRTGAVGLISVTGWEKFKGGTRAEFVCGGRALRRLRIWRDVFSATSRVLSVQPEGLAPAIERLQGENKALGRAVRELQEQLARHEARQLVAEGKRQPDGRVVVVQALHGWDAAGLKAIASAAASSPGLCVAVFSGSTPALAVIARADDVSTVDAAQALKALVAKFGGKGGGTPQFAQGGGLEGDLEEIVRTAHTHLATPNL